MAGRRVARAHQRPLRADAQGAEELGDGEPAQHLGPQVGHFRIGDEQLGQRVGRDEDDQSAGPASTRPAVARCADPAPRPRPHRPWPMAWPTSVAVAVWNARAITMLIERTWRPTPAAACRAKPQRAGADNAQEDHPRTMAQQIGQRHRHADPQQRADRSLGRSPANLRGRRVSPPSRRRLRRHATIDTERPATPQAPGRHRAECGSRHSERRQRPCPMDEQVAEQEMQRADARRPPSRASRRRRRRETGPRRPGSTR